MKVLFRVDAYPEIGLGHFVRSTAIARELREQSSLKIVFAGNYSEHALNVLKQYNFPIFRSVISEKEEDFLVRCQISEKPDLIFIDNLFNYSGPFLHKISNTVKIILFHNLCDGRFNANAFILPSAHHPEEIITDPGWQKNEVSFFHGFEYIPVNEKVRRLPLHTLKKDSDYKLTITTGGSDPRGIMLKLLEWLDKAEYSGISFIVLPGDNFIFDKELDMLKQKMPGNFNFKKFNYPDLESADLVISTFGVTSYELIFLGVPFISIAHAKINARGSQILSNKMAFMADLGLIDSLSENSFHEAMEEMQSKQNLKTEFRKICRDIIDGKGINRIIDVILNQLNK